jgi:hypothetical protein
MDTNQDEQRRKRSSSLIIPQITKHSKSQESLLFSNDDTLTQGIQTNNNYQLLSEEDDTRPMPQLTPKPTATTTPSGNINKL